MAKPIVGEAMYPDNPVMSQDAQRISVYGSNVNSMTPGESFEDTLNGQVQIYKTITPLALLVSATTGNHPTIWNPSTSGKIFIPKKLILGYYSGTTTIGSIVLAQTAAQAGTTVIAITGPIITFTEGATATTKFNGGVGAPNAKAPAMKWAPAVCTFVAAPTVFMETSISLGASSPTNGGNQFVHKFDGESIVWPGQAVSVCFAVTSGGTSTSLWNVTLIGIEKQAPSMR